MPAKKKKAVKKKVAKRKGPARNPVTAKRLQFCFEYLIDMDGTKAAIRAGFSKKTAAAIACELLKVPELKAIIKIGMEKIIDEAQVDAVYVLTGAKEMFERCMQREQIMEKVDGKWIPTGEWKFDSSGAGKALKILGDHVDVNAFKVTDDKGVPIDQNWVTTIVHTTKEAYDKQKDASSNSSGKA